MTKKHMYYIFCCLCVFFLCDISSLQAKANQEVMAEIMQTVNASEGGYVDEELHDKFWNTLAGGKELDGDVKQEIYNVFSRRNDEADKFLIALLDSLAVTFESGKPYFSKEYLERKDNSKETTDQVLRNSIEKFASLGDTAIVAVAEGKPANIPFEGIIEFDTHTIKELRSSHKARFYRLDLIMKPVWVQKVPTWKLNEVGVNVDWQLPFILKIEQQTTGLFFKQTSVGHTYINFTNANHFVSISASSLPEPKKLTFKDLEKSLEITRKRLGFNDSHHREEEFNELTSVVLTGSFSLEGESGFAAIRTFQNPETLKLMQVIALSSLSTEDAAELQAEFENSISFAE